MRLFEAIKSDLSRLDEPSFMSFVKWYFVPRWSTFHHDVWFRIKQKCFQNPILKYTIGLPVYLIERHWEVTYGNTAQYGSTSGGAFSASHLMHFS